MGELVYSSGVEAMLYHAVGLGLPTAQKKKEEEEDLRVGKDEREQVRSCGSDKKGNS